MLCAQLICVENAPIVLHLSLIPRGGIIRIIELTPQCRRLLQEMDGHRVGVIQSYASPLYST